MDEVLELTGRGVETQFQVDRFSSKTLALVYQRLVAETMAEEGQNRGFQQFVSIDRQAFQIVKVTP